MVYLANTEVTPGVLREAAYAPVWRGTLEITVKYQARVPPEETANHARTMALP